MVQLFLSESAWNNNGDDGDDAKLILSLLDKLESNFQSLILHEGRPEARLWLCNTISGMSCISARCQCDVFMSMLKSKPIKRSLAAQLLQMLFEKRPSAAGSVIANKCYMLEKFFKGNPRRILEWFSNFSAVNELEQSKGAKALSKFAFVNRDICWEELEWKGKHGQSPAMVATKPHYFLDLDVQATVENFLEYVPDFWSSNEFAESLKGGEILSIDTKYFVILFIDLMFEEESREVWDAVNDFLTEESFSSISRRLLIVLEERDLCTFLNLIRQFLKPRIKSIDFYSSTSWFEVLLSRFSDYESIDQLLLLNAIINHARQLLKLLRDEECQEEVAKIKDIVMQIVTASSDCKSLDITIKGGNKNILEVIKRLGFQSCVLHYNLSEECRTSASWESLFVKNGLGFRRSGKYGLLRDEVSDNESDLDVRISSTRYGQKKKKRRKNRRRKDIDNDDSFEGELLDFDLSDNGLNLQSDTGSWYLSTDGYSNLWSSVDLPEHISKHCFSTWMKWISANWVDAL